MNLAETYLFYEKSWARPVDDVFDQLLGDFPPDAARWVKRCSWSGPEDVPVDHIDFSKERRWRASREPEKVADFVHKIRAGFRKPIVLVARPDGKGKLRVADGHHRSLAYRKLGREAVAFVAQPADWKTYERAMQMHDSQREKDDGDAEWTRETRMKSKTPKLTEVFRLREADATPKWAADDERARRQRQGAPSPERPRSSPKAPEASKGQPSPAPRKTSSGKPPLAQATGKYLWVNQAAPEDISPYNIKRGNITYDRLPPEPFTKGYVRVEDDRVPTNGWGVYSIGQGGRLDLVADDWDSSD